jgi:hypothetical protein
MDDGATREEVPMDVIDHQQAEREAELMQANHYHRATCPDPCGDGSMMACRHDIGEGKDCLEQMLVAFNRVI